MLAREKDLDRIAEGDQLAQAIRAVASGGSSLDPSIVDAMLRPVTASTDGLSPDDEALLALLAEGKPLKAIAAARQTTAASVSTQHQVNLRWSDEGLPVFDLGIGLSTGDVAAALLGSAERVEYSVVGDAVNLSQRLQQLAAPGQIVVSEPTWDLRTERPADAEHLVAELVKGRGTPVAPWRFGPVE